MALTLGNEVYKDGEEVDYKFLPSYTYDMFHGKKIGDIDPKSVPNDMKTGKLQYNQGLKTFWSTTPSGWILKNSTGKFQYDFNTEVNILNDKPFDKNKRFNILLLKKVQGPVQAKVVAQPTAKVDTQSPVNTVKTLSLGDDDYFNYQKVEYLIVNHPTLYPTLSGTRVDLRGMKDVFDIQNKGELMYNPISFAGTVGWWIVEGGKMTHDLSKFNILNNRPFTTNKSNIQFLPSGNMTERMKQVKAEKERKSEEAAKEDQAEETNFTPIPCSQTTINLKDRVIYNFRKGTITGFEITYDENEPKTQTVRCDDELLSITAGIQKNKSDLFTKRNPGVVYAHVVAGSRKRRKTKHRR